MDKLILIKTIILLLITKTYCQNRNISSHQSNDYTQLVIVLSVGIITCTLYLCCFLFCGMKEMYEDKQVLHL